MTNPAPAGLAVVCVMCTTVFLWREDAMFNICLSFIHPQWGNNTQARTICNNHIKISQKESSNQIDRDREHICSIYSKPHILILSNPRGPGQLVNRYCTHKCLCHLLSNVYACVQGGGATCFFLGNPFFSCSTQPGRMCCLSVRTVRT